MEIKKVVEEVKPVVTPVAPVVPVVPAVEVEPKVELKPADKVSTPVVEAAVAPQVETTH